MKLFYFILFYFILFYFILFYFIYFCKIWQFNNYNTTIEVANMERTFAANAIPINTPTTVVRLELRSGNKKKAFFLKNQKRQRKRD